MGTLVDPSRSWPGLFFYAMPLCNFILWVLTRMLLKALPLDRRLFHSYFAAGDTNVGIGPTRQVREIGVTNVLFNLDILKRKLRNFPINPFRGPVLIPAVCSHFGLRLVSRTSISDNSVLETPLPEREPHHHTLTKSTANHYLWDALPRMIAELDVYVKLG
jgi:hypothetical protein